MQINVTFDQVTSSLPAGFVTAINYVVNYLDTTFTNNVTVNLDVGYGEIDGQALGSNDLGESIAPVYLQESYSSVRGALQTRSAPGANTLPSNSPLLGNLIMPQAEAAALGLTSAASTVYVGFSNSNNLPFSYTPNVTPTSGQYYFVGVAEHEITEDMGRVSLLDEQPSDYSPIDLFRYSSPGVRDLMTGRSGSTAYFSTDNGTTNLGTWNNHPANGDLADWYPSGPAPGGFDAFNDYSNSDVINAFSTNDLTLMEALGWSTTANGIVVSATGSEALQGGSPIPLLSNTPTITDSAQTTIASATIKISNGSGTAVAGDELFINGQQSGTVNSGAITVGWNSSTDTLTLTGNATIAAYEALLNAITYQDTGTDLSTGSHPQRTVTWTVNAGTTNFSTTSNITIDRPPVVTASNQSIATGAIVAASSLFSVSDLDGDAITQYGLYDNSSAANSGHFVVNGVVQPGLQDIFLTPAQLAQTTFVPGSNGATADLFVNAFDGTAWGGPSWTEFQITASAPQTPVVSASNQTLASGTPVAASSLFSVTDPAGHAITEYGLYDNSPAANSGHFVVNGVVQPALQDIFLTPLQLAQTTFVPGSNGSIADLFVDAYDGTAWGAPSWTEFQITASAPQTPVVSASNQTLASGTPVAASSLFSVTDPAGHAITEYGLYDNSPAANSGHFVVNGVVQPALQDIFLTPAQLAQTTFVPGSNGSTADLFVDAYDGTAWGAPSWTEFQITASAPQPPVVTATDQNITSGASVAASSLFSVTDPAGHAITEYGLYDNSPAANSGHFVVNGVVQPALQNIFLTPAQLAQTTFVAGSTGSIDDLFVNAFDGTSWGAPSWTEFHVSAVSGALAAAAEPQVALLGQYIASGFHSTPDPGAATAVAYVEPTPNSQHVLASPKY